MCGGWERMAGFLLAQPPTTGGLLGRAWSGLTCSPNLRLEARGSSNFLRWESVVGLKRLGVFRVNRRRRGSFSVGGDKGSRCTQPASRPLLRSAGKMQTVFIFHLSLQEVEVGVRRGGGGSPARPRLNFRAEETYLRSPSFPPLLAQRCPWAPSWLQPAQQEGVLGHQSEGVPGTG